MEIKSALFRIVRGNAVGATLALLIGVLSSRWLGPAGRGEYALFFTTVGVASIFGQVGVYQASIYLVSKGLVGLNEAFGVLVGIVAFDTVLLAAALSTALYVVPAHLLPFDSSLIGFAFLVSVICVVLQEGLGGLAMASQRHNIYASQLALEPSLIFLATLPLIFLSGSAVSAILLRVCASSVAIAIMFIRIQSALHLLPKFDVQSLKKEFVFGSKVLSQNVLGVLNYRIYIYFLASVPASAGRFSVALLFCELVRFFPNAVGTASLPYLATYGPIESSALAARICRITLAIGVAIVLFFWPLLASIIGSVFGASFLPATGPTLVMMIGTIFASIYQVFTRYFMGMGRQAVSVTAAAAGLTSAVASCLVLVPEFGLNGAAYSYLICSIVTALYLSVAFCRQSKMRIRHFLFLRRTDLQMLADFVNQIAFSR